MSVDRSSPQATASGTTAWIGLALGLVLGAIDVGLMLVLGVRIEWNGGDGTLLVVAFVAANYGAMGFIIGMLVQTRRRLRRDAEVIREQYAALEASQAKVLEYEKLASIGRLAAGVAHEVRNSLGVVRSSASLLAEGTERSGGDPVASAEENRRACRFIQEEIDCLDGFIRALLDFSKPIQAHARPVELSPLLDRVVALTRVEQERDGFTVEAVVAGQAVAGAGGPIRVDADPDLLTQALLALATNAGQAAGRGADGQAGVVRLAVSLAGDSIIVDVADDGPGVGAEDVGRIFEPFFTTKAQGTGLGLPMARRIIEAHAGTMKILAGAGLGPAGAGACFRVTLPSSRDRASDGATGAESLVRGAHGDPPARADQDAA